MQSVEQNASIMFTGAHQVFTENIRRFLQRLLAQME